MTRGLDTTIGRSAIGVAAVLALVTAFGWPEAATSTAEKKLIVLVSGRDDHGLEVADELPLHDRPGGSQIRTVPADTLAVVTEKQGTWLRISTLDGSPPTQGWIDEFLVRGQLHLVHPQAPGCAVATAEGELPASARVRVVDVHPTASGRLGVGVVPVAGGAEHHVERSWLRELPGPQPVDGDDCEAAEDVPLEVHEH